MLQIKDLSLIRTSRDYRNSSIRDMVIEAAQAPITFFTRKKITEHFLKNISLSVTQGERIALIGRNGSGKSTLCRIIAKQLFPSEGSIALQGRVSLFSQIEESFFKDLTGRENLQLFIAFIYSHLAKKMQTVLLQDCITFSGLDKKIDRPVYSYSLGMLSRLALSLITAYQHDILVLDEVHNHADINFRKSVSARFEKTVTSSKTLILVSHYEEDLLKNCDRGLVLEKGQIIFDGPLQKALACYKLLPRDTYV